MEAAATEGQSWLKTFHSFHKHRGPCTELPPPTPHRPPGLRPTCMPPYSTLTPVFPALAQHVLVGLIQLAVSPSFSLASDSKQKLVCWEQAWPMEAKWGQRPVEAGSLGYAPALMPSSLRTLARRPPFRPTKGLGQEGHKDPRAKCSRSAQYQTPPPCQRTGGPRPLGQSAPSESWRATAAVGQRVGGRKAPGMPTRHAG